MRVEGERGDEGLWRRVVWYRSKEVLVGGGEPLDGLHGHGAPPLASRAPVRFLKCEGFSRLGLNSHFGSTQTGTQSARAQRPPPRQPFLASFLH